MLPGGTDGLYRSGLAHSHRLTARIEVYDTFGPAAVLLEPELPFLSGSVNATLNSRVTRTMDFTVDQRFYPLTETDLLAPYGNVAVAYRGIQIGSTSYEWIVFSGRIQHTALSSNGLVSVRCADQASDIVAFGFESPRNSDAGINVVAELQTLVSQALPTAAFGVSDSYSERVRELTWEQDRAGALDEISFSVGSFWYALADGRFVMRRYPWTVPSAPIAVITDHSDTGVMTRWDVSRSREGVFNSVTVSGERLNGDQPVFYTARDFTVGSPSLYGGHFGVRTEHLRLQTPGSVGAAQAAANDALRRDTALVESWTWEQIPDAAMELGDVLELQAAGRTGVIQVVDSFTLPLDTDRPMNVSGRSLIVPVLGQSSLPS